MTYDFTYELEEITINDKCYGVNVEVTYEGEMVDNGIGPYEFWGSRATDVRIESEIDKIEYEIISVTDDDLAEVDFPPQLVKDACEAHFKAYPEYWQWIVDACESDFESQISD